jgi:L-ascorbate metabolism protein UlaG (beta-lactamase superfamily)
MTAGRIVRLLVSFFFDGFRRIPPALHHPEPARWLDTEITGACLGHSTVLINFLGVWIVTDPVLASRCGLRFGPFVIGPRRWVRPALRVKDLPPIDLLLLSHSHMDHLDLWTLRRLPGRPHAVTATGMRDLLAGMRLSGITELAWDQSAEIATPHGAVQITARQVAHWGARMRTDDWRGYTGFVMERGGRKIGFTGDTDFKHWADGSDIDLLAIPIGAYNPWVTAHCNPEEAVAMANEARARLLLPIHHQTFQLSAEPREEPIARFRAALAATPERMAATEIGETFRIPV